MEPEALPRRNLGEGEHWGRTLERRQETVAKHAGMLNQSLGGTNRNTASSLADIQRQAVQLEIALGAVPVALQASNYNSGFTVPATWTSRSSASIVVPPGKSVCNMIARGSASIDWVAATSGGGERFQWPFSLGSVTKEYGPDPMYFDGMHKGIDFGQAGGTPIIAPGSGYVTTKSYDSERGNYVIIDHGDGLSTWYYHLQSPSPLSVGSPVTKGVTYIGPVGSTGLSTGNHLHWETRVYGSHMNPRDFMDLYADSGSSSIPFDFGCQLVIGGSHVLFYRSSREPVTGDSRFYIAGGRSFPVSPGTVVSAEIYLISTNGLENPAYADTFAAISAFGVFT